MYHFNHFQAHSSVVFSTSTSSNMQDELFHFAKQTLYSLNDNSKKIFPNISVPCNIRSGPLRGPKDTAAFAAVC